MCKSKRATNAAEPKKPPARTSTATLIPSSLKSPEASTANPSTSTTSTSYSTGASSSYILGASTATTTASISGRTSLSSLRDTLPEKPHIYDFSEIRSATNNFLARRYSSSSSSPSWRCNLRGKDVVVFQRKLGRSLDELQLKERLSVICRSHHTSIIKLLGVSISGLYMFFVYEFVKGASLSDCLRNSKNPNFTVLSNWMSRMQVATDLAHGLEYIHNSAIGLNVPFVHKHIKSTSVIVSEPSFNAKICHFGAAELCGETETAVGGLKRKNVISSEIEEEDAPKLPSIGMRRFQGVRGYMSPEFQSTGIATQSSDVYAFGVLILELMSGHEPVKYKFDKTSGEYQKMSVVDAAGSAIQGDGGEEEVELRLRRWVDRRLKDSFPVTVAERMVKLALECSQDEPDKRPSMRLVAGKISKLYLDSRKWSEKVRVPTDFSYSYNPR